ncbi:MAG: S26 family signal peptidase [Candidatus Nitrosopolaris sp.]
MAANPNADFCIDAKSDDQEAYTCYYFKSDLSNDVSTLHSSNRTKYSHHLRACVTIVILICQKMKTAYFMHTIPVIIVLSICIRSMAFAQNNQQRFDIVDKSMLPDLHLDDIVIVDGYVLLDSLKVGDIIVFKPYGTNRSREREIIAHREAEIIHVDDAQRIIRTKCDVNDDLICSIDYPIFQQNYIGNVIDVKRNPKLLY